MHQKRVYRCIAVILFFGICAPLTAQTKSEIASALRAQKQGTYAENFLPTPKESPFALHAVADGIVIGTGAALVATDLLLEYKLKPKPTEYSGVALNINNVTGIDRKFMRPYSKTLDIVGDAAQILTMLTPAVLLAAPKSEYAKIAVMYGESVLLAYGIKELGKNLVYRARPYMYFDGAPKEKIDKGDWNASFPSGHSTLAFNGAAFTSYVFSEYFPDSKMKVPVIAASYALATGTAALRMASGNHFFTDVLTGAVIGTQTGLLVPMVHSVLADLNKTAPFSVSLMPTGLFCKYSY